MGADNRVLLALWDLMVAWMGPLLFAGFFIVAASTGGVAGLLQFAVQHNFEQSYASGNEGCDHDRGASDCAGRHGQPLRSDCRRWRFAGPFTVTATISRSRLAAYGRLNSAPRTLSGDGPKRSTELTAINGLRRETAQNIFFAFVRGGLMKLGVRSRVAILLTLASWAVAANALLVTSPVPMHSDTLSFDNYGFQAIGSGLVVATTLGESIFLSASENGLIADNAAFDANGYWPTWPPPGPAFGSFAVSSSGDDPWARFLRFRFSEGPVADVRGFTNYCVSDYAEGCARVDVTISAYGADGSLLEAYNLLDSAPIPNGGAYRGISRPLNDIAEIAISSSGTFFAVDDLHFARVSAVPEPSTLAMGLIGGLLLLSRRNWTSKGRTTRLLSGSIVVS